MSIETGMIVKTLTAGSAHAIENQGTGLTLTATLVANPPTMNGKPARITWGPTGSQWLSSPRTISVTADQQVQFDQVPACDQPQWCLNGSPIVADSVAFTYTLNFTVGVGSGKSGFSIGPFVILSDAADPVDADSLLDLVSDTGHTILVPDQWSALVAQAAQDAADAEAAAAASAQSAQDAADTVAAMPVGPQGPSGTTSVGTVTTGAAGSSASVTNSGTSTAAVLDFTIPKGDKGDKGDTGNTGATGAAATIAVGTTTTGAAGSSASVSNSGTSGAAVFNFTIPKGDKGDTGATGPGAGFYGQVGPVGSFTGTYADNTMIFEY